MEELIRFLNSIKFTYNDNFKDTEIEKVILNRNKNLYTVYLKSKNVINYNEINELFRCAKNRINGKDECYIIMNYENILPSYVSDYTKEVLNAIVFEHPSLTGIENSFQSIEDNIINLEVGSVIEKNTLLKMNLIIMVF